MLPVEIQDELDLSVWKESLKKGLAHGAHIHKT